MTNHEARVAVAKAIQERKCPRCGRAGVIECRMQDWQPICNRTLKDRERS